MAENVPLIGVEHNSDAESADNGFEGISMLGTPKEWVQQVARACQKERWEMLVVSERKKYLYYLYHSKDERLAIGLILLIDPIQKFLEAVQYVLECYHDCDIEDLEESANLLPVLPTLLAVKVVKFNCSREITPKHVPFLMKKGIRPLKLQKLLRASQERRKREHLDGGLQADGGTLDELEKTPLEEVKDLIHKRTNENSNVSDRNLLDLLQIFSWFNINFNECPTSHGTLLHAVAKFGLAESAKELITQGYHNMLLENYDDQPHTWPLWNAIEKKHWSTVKIILEALSTSEKQTQIKALLPKIGYKGILREMSDSRKHSWSFQSEDLQEKLENEGRLLLLQTVLDTTMKACEVDPTLLFDDEIEDDGITVKEDFDSGDGITVGAGFTRISTAQSHSVGGSEKSLFREITESAIDELKCHPAFATIVEHKWRQGYAYFHGFIFAMYLVFIIVFTIALSLAAKSSDPRTYTSPIDRVRLLLEIFCFLYLSAILSVNGLLFVDEIHEHCCEVKRIKDLLVGKINGNLFFELLWFSSVLFIIPFRIANEHHQWWISSLAIILSGLRLFRYATVLPFMDKYVGTLILIVKHDLPRLFGVFVVITFSFGTGLYFALVDHYHDHNVDIENRNVTSEVYSLWLIGVQMVIEGSVLTYIGNNGFNFPGRLVYWLFAFCVTVAFAAILIAQIETSFDTLACRASLNVILRKSEIMHETDRILEVFRCNLCRIPSCEKYLTESEEEKEQYDKGIRRQTICDSEILDRKDYALFQLSRKLAENDKQVQMLGKKLDELLSLQKRSNGTSL